MRWAGTTLLCRLPDRPAPAHLLRGFEMGAVVAHDGGHALIVVIGVLVAGVLAAVAWVRSR
jgi:hypothetical protein